MFSIEVYLIKCLINNKVYIGSTKYSKEKRWKTGKGFTSHIHVAYSISHKERNKPLYQDIRKYGEDNFVLYTLEKDFDPNDRYKIETKWIKYYIQLLGEHQLYNEIDRATPIHYITDPDEKQRRAETYKKTMMTKQGSVTGHMMTQEARKKANEKIRAAAIGRIPTEETKEKRRQHSSNIIKYKDNIYYGAREFAEKLREDGYNDISNNVCSKMLTGYFSKANQEKYPDLIPGRTGVIWELVKEYKHQMTDNIG